MSSPLMDLITSQLSGSVLDGLTATVGGDRKATNRAVATAIPVLVQALTRNAQQGTGSGATGLAAALDRDHDGSILDDLAGFVTSGKTSVGDGILRHMLGNERPQVEQQLAKTTGLNTAQVGRLIAMLAPIILGALGKQKRERGLDSGGLGDLLGQASRQASAPGLGGLGRLLDTDGDGDVMDDVAKLGTSLLGGLFQKR